METLKGRILWWSVRDENGIIVGENGLEYYFDRSVVNDATILKDGGGVEFEHNYSIKDTRCAHYVQPLGN